MGKHPPAGRPPGQTAPGRQIPPPGRHPLGRHPSLWQADTPLAGRHPWADTLPGRQTALPNRHPPWADPPHGWPLQWMVHILLECILLLKNCKKNVGFAPNTYFWGEDSSCQIILPPPSGEQSPLKTWGCTALPPPTHTTVNAPHPLPHLHTVKYKKPKHQHHQRRRWIFCYILSVPCLNVPCYWFNKNVCIN